MSSLCCIGLTISARMIGSVTLAFSILLINVFSSHLITKNHDTNFLLTLESWAPVGLSWTFIFKYIKLENQCQIITISCSAIILYSIMFFIVSGFLAYGSIVRKSKYAVPWLYVQMFNIMNQLMSLGFQLIREGYAIFNKYTLYASLCCIYLLFNVYFWIVVDNARKEWSKYTENQVSENQIPEENVTNQVTVKSPSYVSTSLMTNPRSAFQQSNDLPSYDSLDNIR